MSAFSHQAVDHFEAHGPYTFEEVFRLATLCVERPQDDCQVGDTLDNLLSKFPPAELQKLLHQLRC